MKNRASYKPQRGFTLTEAMISLTVLTSGLLALAQFQGDLNRQSGETRSQAKAIDLAHQKLEELRLLSLVDTAAVTDGSDRVASAPGDNTRFERHWTVQSHTDPSYKEVAVRTDWTTAGGERHTAAVSSILTGGRPYSAGDNAGQELTPVADTEEDEAPRAADLAAQAALSDVATPPEPRVVLVTCICTLDIISGRATLDQRNNNPSCSNACCERERPARGAPLCSRDSCPFIAQCRSG